MIDSHVHIRGFDDDLLENLALHEEIRVRAGMEAVNAAALPAWDYESAYQNVLCALFKALYPKNYCYFGFDYHVEGLDTTPDGRLGQVKDFLGMGFDGLKIIEGKPSVRKAVGRTLLGEEFGKAFAYLEDNNIPILWHVADPEENWDRRACNDYVIEHGWCYDGPEYPSKAEIIAEAGLILDRYPGLNVTFAHLLFASFDIGFARRFMEKHPNACLDVTPGIELYKGIDDDREAWREFFVKYQNRILFGTDNGWGEDSPARKIESGLKNIAFIVEFLTTEKVVAGYNNVPVRGIALPRDVVNKLLAENFALKKNARPKRLDVARVASYGGALLEKITGSALYPDCTKRRARQAFEALRKLR